MGLEAAGTYLRTLRERQGLTRLQVAEASGTSESQLVRIEGGKQDPRGSLWFAIAGVLKGSTEQLSRLLTEPDLTPEDGRRFAEEWLTQDQRDTIDRLYQTYGDERVQAAVQSLQELSSDQLLRVIAEASEVVRLREAQARYTPKAAPRRRLRWPRRRPKSDPTDEQSS